jgi:hypothetical protein
VRRNLCTLIVLGFLLQRSDKSLTSLDVGDEVEAKQLNIVLLLNRVDLHHCNAYCQKVDPVTGDNMCRMGYGDKRRPYRRGCLAPYCTPRQRTDEPLPDPGECESCLAWW